MSRRLIYDWLLDKLVVNQTMLSSNLGINQPRFSCYADEDEVLAITSTDYTSVDGWKTPTTGEKDETEADLLKDFDYTTNVGSITYVGKYPIIVEVYLATSIKSDTNFTLVRLKWCKNCNVVTEPTRFITDKITNANSTVLLTCKRQFKLVYGDYLNFFLGADKLCNLTIMKSECTINTNATLL